MIGGVRPDRAEQIHYQQHGYEEDISFRQFAKTVIRFKNCLWDVDTSCNDQNGKEPGAGFEEVRLEIEVVGKLPRIQQRSRQKKYNGIQKQKQKIEKGSFRLTAPPKHTPPDDYDLDQYVDRPHRMDPIKLYCLSVVNRLADPGKEMGHPKTYDDREQYPYVFKYAQVCLPQGTVDLDD